MLANPASQRLPRGAEPWPFRVLVVIALISLAVVTLTIGSASDHSMRPIANHPLSVAQGVYYGGTNSPSMVASTGSGLVLRATRTSDARYLSSEVDSRPFTFGDVSVTAQLPAGVGMWPAFWLVQPNSSRRGTPEIDILEVPQKTSVAHLVMSFTYHWTDASGVPWSIGRTLALGFDPTRGFHTYRVRWRADSITWWVDSKEVMRVETSARMSTGQVISHPGQPDQRVEHADIPIPITAVPMYLRLNNGVGYAGSWAGAPDSSTPFPNSLIIHRLAVKPVFGSTTDFTAGTFALGGR